jgi:hypothetical protein
VRSALLTRLLAAKNSALAARFPLPFHFAISLLAAGRSKRRKANSEKSACARRFACFVVSRNRFSLRPGAKLARAKSFRRLRRAFLYRSVLQFRFWLQREAKNKKQSRSNSAISATTFPVNLKNFELAALFWPFPKRTRRARIVATRSALVLPLLAEKNSTLAARFPSPFHFAISLLTAGRSKQSKANSEKSACAQCFACFVVSRNRFSLQPGAKLALAKKFRRLRRAFFYRFVLQFRFWLQREAKNQKQRRSSSALSSQTFPVRIKKFALAALFRPFLQKARRGRSAAARSAALRPLLTQKNSALAARFPLSFHFAISLLAAGRSKPSKASSEKKACAQRFACFVVL